MDFASHKTGGSRVKLRELTHFNLPTQELESGFQRQLFAVASSTFARVGCTSSRLWPECDATPRGVSSVRPGLHLRRRPVGPAGPGLRPWGRQAAGCAREGGGGWLRAVGLLGEGAVACARGFGGFGEVARSGGFETLIHWVTSWGHWGSLFLIRCDQAVSVCFAYDVGTPSAKPSVSLAL